MVTPNPIFFLFLVPGVLLLCLAAYVFWLDPGDRLGRAFALVAAVQGMGNMMSALVSNVFEYPGVVQVYVLLALPFTYLYFGFEFFVRQRATVGGGRRWVPYLILALAALSLVLFALDHSLYATYDPTPKPTNTYGPLSAVAGTRTLVMTVVSFLFVAAHVRRTSSQRHRAFYTAAVAFNLLPVYFATFFGVHQIVRGAAQYYDTTWEAVESVLVALPLLVALASWVVLRRAASAASASGLKTDARHWAWTVFGLAMFGTLAGLNTEFPVLTPRYLPHVLALALCAYGFATLCLVVVLRHRVLEIEHRVKIVIRSSVVATVFVGVTFVVVEVAAQKLSNNLSLGVGGIAAGLLLFTLHPLQRLAERIAYRTLPRGRPVGDLSPDERSDVYYEQAVIAWADGALERKERLLLDRLRERLGLSFEEARRLEKKALPK